MQLTENLRKKQVNILFLILFTDMIGFGMSIPLFGILFGAKDSQFYLGNVLSISNITLYFGLFTALYGFGQFLANPILGALSDSVGRKPVLSFAIFGTFLSRLLFIFGLLRMNIFLIFFSRFLDGGTGGIMSLAGASVTDTTTAENRMKYMGKIMSGFSLGGFIVGPILFTLFSYTGDFWSIVGPFAFVTLLSFIAFLFSFFFFPETLSKEKIHNIPSTMVLWEKLLHSLDNLKIVVKEKNSRPFFIAAGVYYLGFSAYTTFSSQFLVSNYGLDAKSTGIYFLLVGIVMVLMQGFLAYKIIAKYPMKQNIVLISILLCISMFVFTFASSKVLLYLNAVFFAFLVSLSMVSMQTEVSKIKSEHRGALMGAFSSIQVLSMTLAPILAGLVSKFSVTLPFVMAGLLLLFSGYLLRKAV